MILKYKIIAVFKYKTCFLLYIRKYQPPQTEDIHEPSSVRNFMSWQKTYSRVTAPLALISYLWFLKLFQFVINLLPTNSCGCKVVWNNLSQYIILKVASPVYWCDNICILLCNYSCSSLNYGSDVSSSVTFTSSANQSESVLQRQSVIQ